MIETQQILIPKKVHIGDTAELRCTFHGDSQELISIVSDGTANLPLSVFTTPVDSENFEILNVSIAQAGVNYYQLSITFIPWKSGPVKLPNLSVAGIEIGLKPVEIVSLTKQLNTTTLKESKGPLLLPGTTYKLWGSVILGIILLILGINLIVRRKKVSFFFKNLILRMKYRKNKKLTIKKLKKICNPKYFPYSVSDNDGDNMAKAEARASEEIQHILRSYLEFRFAYPFTKIVTSEMMMTFNKITQMLLSDEKYEAFGDIVSIFIRTDYIRYSGATNVDEYETNDDSTFQNKKNGERKALVERAIKDIEILEGDDKVEQGEDNA